MAYLLNREAMRVVERNDRGNVTYRKRYKRGDEVDVSHIDDAQVENLVESGALVQSEDDLSEPESAGATSPVSGPHGAATGEAEDHSDLDEDSSSDDEDHDVDQYDSMDYSELQAEAKRRDLSAGGSAQDLRARLRDSDDEA